MTEKPRIPRVTTTGAGLLAHYQNAAESIDAELREQRVANLRYVAADGYPNDGKHHCGHCCPQSTCACVFSGKGSER